ncbi:hypothetical protein OSB04_026092 [Centaurea solstitialis]|uniref:Uncharacterized protein n=1 Tax=Centaurea solstitialis TaxID=347529 RepID=A0AA38W8Z2_9ASTR|nr:hypothetical protein OSB04_026092 [Centaurea solstitialis]
MNSPPHPHPQRSSLSSIQSKGTEHSHNGGAGSRRIWRRRKLTKKDELMTYRHERAPFLEEQIRDIWESGKLVMHDIERLKLWEENTFDFAIQLAAEANELVNKDKDAYGGKKKALLHAISNRMNDMGFYRPEAYIRRDPLKHLIKREIDDDED